MHVYCKVHATSDKDGSRKIKDHPTLVTNLTVIRLLCIWLVLCMGSAIIIMYAVAFPRAWGGFLYTQHGVHSAWLQLHFSANNSATV